VASAVLGLDRVQDAVLPVGSDAAVKRGVGAGQRDAGLQEHPALDAAAFKVVAMGGEVQHRGRGFQRLRRISALRERFRASWHRGR
jgi:hypothetical protein